MVTDMHQHDTEHWKIVHSFTRPFL